MLESNTSRFVSVSDKAYQTVGFDESDAPIVTIEIFTSIADLLLVGL